jgi:hypothetical protein
VIDGSRMLRSNDTTSGNVYKVHRLPYLCSELVFHLLVLECRLLISLLSYLVCCVMQDQSQIK